MFMSFYAAYLIFNVIAALVITGLFAGSGAVLMRAIVKCSATVPVATVRILSLVYGTLALGRVFTGLEPLSQGGTDKILLRLSDATGTNLMFFAVLAGIGIVILLIAARPVVDLLLEMDRRQDAAL